MARKKKFFEQEFNFDLIKLWINWETHRYDFQCIIKKKKTTIL